MIDLQLKEMTTFFLHHQSVQIRLALSNLLEVIWKHLPGATDSFSQQAQVKISLPRIPLYFPRSYSPPHYLYPLFSGVLLLIHSLPSRLCTPSFPGFDHVSAYISTLVLPLILLSAVNFDPFSD